MEHEPESNHDLSRYSFFEVFNAYFLLFFSVSCVISSVFIQQLFAMADQFRLGLIVAPLMGIVGPIYLLARRFAPGFRAQLCIGPLYARPALYTFLAALAMVVVVDYLYILSQYVAPVSDDYIEGLKEIKPTSWSEGVITFLGLCVVVPLAEEIAFRGMIQQVFERNMSAVLAVVLAGVFFGAIHLNPNLLASMVAFGIFLGAIFHATASISYTVLAHAVLNTVAFIQLTSWTDEVVETAPVYLQQWWIPVIAAVVVIVLVNQIRKGANPGDAP